MRGFIQNGLRVALSSCAGSLAGIFFFSFFEIVLFDCVIFRYTQSLIFWETPIPRDEFYRFTTHIYIEDSANDTADNTS